MIYYFNYIYILINFNSRVERKPPPSKLRICSLHFKPKADVEGGELLPGQWQEGKYCSKKPYALLSNFPGKWLIDPTITSLTAKKRFDFPEPGRKTKRPQSCVDQDEPVHEDDRPLTATFSSLNIGQCSTPAKRRAFRNVNFNCGQNSPIQNDLSSTHFFNDSDVPVLTSSLSLPNNHTLSVVASPSRPKSS